MCRCSVTSKVFLVVLGFIFWAVAAGLIFVGAWVYKEYHNYENIAQSLYTLVPATIILATGIFMFILGIIGCAGAIKEQKCLLGVFFTILLVILVGMVAAAVLGYVYREEVDNKLEDTLMDVVQKQYTVNNSVIREEVDFMQTQLKCCGVTNYTDWINSEWAHEHPNTTYPFPSSCCINETCNQEIPPAHNKNLYHRPCYGFMKKQFLGHLGVVAGVAATLTVVLLLGMGCSCVLICRKRAGHQYIGLTSPEHMRV